jgi:hypothetical protein
MPIYEKCDEEVTEIVNKWIAFHLPRLSLSDLTVGAVYFRCTRNEQGDRVGSPLRLHGYPAAAIVRVNSPKHRAQGLADVEIVIDADTWEGLGKPQKHALIDHELERLDSVKKDGAAVMDDLDRPRLRLRLHDWHLEGFRSVCERHQEHALEAKAANDFAVEYAQLLFPWAGPPPAEREKHKKRRIAESN